jgi:nucleotide-binding universal stress UspA family protein
MVTVRGILHPTDFSDLSNNAFRLACGLAHDYQAPLHILYVATAFEAYKHEIGYKQGSAHYLEKDWERLRAYEWPGVEIHRLLVEGEPAEQILRVSHAIPCDFIVMGSHGRSGLPRLLLGSVAESVLRDANCQVIIVKAPVFPRGSAADDLRADTAITEMHRL